ncbi:MAG: MFS transporter [Candidatus Nanopelagicales bacterium]|nr:MFS transporter [Candidatus Nanopelagicales bacterium]
MRPSWRTLAGWRLVVAGRVFAWARRSPYLAGLPRDVAVLSFVAFAVALGYGIAAPVIPVYARTFGVSAFWASTVISGFALMRLLSAAPAGLAVDRFGERRVMSLGIWIVAGSSLVTAAAQSFPQLLVLRGLGGIGSSMFTVSAMALLLRRAGPEQRGRASGAWQAGFLFGGVAGPAVGGLVTGISIRAPFVVYGATLVVAGIIASRYLSREDPVDRTEADAAGTAASGPRDPDADADAPGPVTLSAALRLAAFRAALVVNLASGFVFFGLRISLVPLFVTESLQRGVGLVGAGFVLATAVQAAALVPSGRRTDTRGRRPSLLFGAAALTVSMLLLVLETGWVGLLVAMGLSGLAAAFLGAPAAAVVGDVTGGQSGGRVVSAYQMVGDLGGILGPLAAGLLADALGFHWAFGTGLAVALLTAVMVLAMPETLRRPSPEPSRR